MASAITSYVPGFKFVKIPVPFDVIATAGTKPVNSKLVAPAELAVIEPVETEHVGCTRTPVGIGGVTGCAFTINDNTVDEHPFAELVTS